MSRRRLIGLLAGAGAGSLVGCASLLPAWPAPVTPGAVPSAAPPTATPQPDRGPTGTTFAQLLDEAALISMEIQLHVADVVGPDSPFGGRYRINWNSQTISFRSADAVFGADAHLLGDAAPGPDEWQWGWASASSFPDAALVTVRQIKAYGEQHQIRELLTPQIPLDGEQPRVVAQRIAAVSSLLSDLRPHYTFETDGGTVGALLMDHPRFALPAPDTLRVVKVLHDTLSATTITDWPRAVDRYAAVRGLTVTGHDQRQTLSGPTIDPIELTLDDQGRPVRFEADVQPH